MVFGLVEIAVGGFFIAWLVLTILFQFDSLAVPISRFDYFRLIPRWTFFSPNPGHHDLHVLYRDRNAAGHMTEWQELPFPAPSTTIPILWNPEKRMNKILWDSWLSIQYLTTKENVPAAHLPLAGAYMVLLNIVMRGERNEEYPFRQFSLVRSTGFSARTPEPIFVSTFHSFENGTAAGGHLSD
jgi:hypothetical protein